MAELVQTPITEVTDKDLERLSFVTAQQFFFRQQAASNLSLTRISSDILQQIISVEFDSTIETLPTRAVTVIDLPEATIDTVNSTFVYNRFEKTERLSRTSPDAIVDLGAFSNHTFQSVDDAEKLDRLKSRYASPARYVRINFSLDDSVASEFAAPYFQAKLDEMNLRLLNPGGTTNTLRTKIQQIIRDLDPSQILIEGGMSSFYYSGTELIDTGLDKKFYNFLINSIRFQEKRDNITPDSSLQDRLKEYMSNSTVPSLEHLGQQIITELGQRGYNSPGSQNRKEIDNVKTLTHKLTFNNKFFDHITRASLDSKTSVYEDEMRAYQSVSEQISQTTINNTIPNTLTENEFVTQLGSTFLYDFEVLDDALDFDAEANLSPGIVHIGFLIEKIEIIGSESNFLQPIIVSATGRNFIDVDVAYDATYVYKVRTLYAVEYDCISDTDQIVRAVFIVASGPSHHRIRCVENVPPKPPQSLKFKYNHKLKGLDINWEFPPNPQGDIKGFSVFRRKSTREPFTLIKEYDFDDSVIRVKRNEKASAKSYQRLKKDGITYVLTNCIDNDFDKKSEYIYAVGCFDAHNLVSNLSSQFKVKYNNKKRKVDVEIVSASGAPRAYPNVFLKTDFFKDTIKVSGKDRMTVFFDPEYYKLTRTVGPQNGNQSERVIDFLTTTSEDDVTHKINFVNVDLQKNCTIDIKVKDRSTPNGDLGHPSLEVNNLSFSLKHSE